MAWDRILDVSNPSESGSALPGLIRGAGNGATNSARFSALVNESTTKAIYFPTGVWEFSSIVSFNNRHGIHIFGGGGQAKGRSAMKARQGPIVFICWTGSTAGPMWKFNNSDGVIVENLSFDGNLGPDTIAGGAGSGLSSLIQWNALQSGFFQTFRNCTFFDAQKLFYCVDSDQAGPADILFDKCLWNNGEDGNRRLTSHAFYADENQCVNVEFRSNEYNQVACAAGSADSGGGNGPGGRFSWTGKTTVAHTLLMLQMNGGSQNVVGHSIGPAHLDGQDGPSGGRVRYYESLNPNCTAGPVTIEHMQPGTHDMVSDEFVSITSYVDSGGNGVLTLAAGGMWLREGDKVLFVLQGDLFTRQAEATIKTRNSNTSYVTEETASSFGLTAPISSNYYACCGEPLIKCVSSEFVELRNSFLTGQQMYAGRLAKLSHSSFATGRSPKLHVRNCMGFWGVPFSEDGFESLLQLTGTCYWLFENVDPISDGNAPGIFGNFGIATIEGSGGNDTIVIEQENQIIMRRYAIGQVIKFSLKGTDGKFKPGVTFAAGDVKIVIGTSAPVNTTNLPSEIGGGEYQITLTSAELTAKNSHLLIQDQTVPAVFASTVVNIDTYGDTNAQHKLDIDVADVRSNVKQLDDATAGVSRLKRAAESMVLGTVGSGSTVNSVVSGSLDPSPTAANQLRNRVLYFDRSTTTAALRGRAADVTDSTAGGVLTVSPALPTAPVSGDLFIVS